jgi:salicylate hydroxylase
MPDALPSPDEPILIAGAGIGGLTLALALARQGRRVIVIEKRTALEEVGAGIQLSPNASHVLIGLGVGTPLLRAAGEPSGLDVRNGRSGTLLAAAPLGAAMRERYGAPWLVIHRADLQTILLDAVRSTPFVKLCFGRSLSGVEDADKGVVAIARSAHQEERFTGAALIGADGLWSRTASLIRDRSKPYFGGHVAWRGTVPRERCPDALPADRTGLWLGPRAHLVHYPIRGGRMINVVAVIEGRDASPGWSRPGDAVLCRQRFADWAQPARALIAAVDDWTIWSLYERRPRRRWTRGRVTLMGDAAHPVLPFLAQGGALAIEDAAVLAGAIAAAPDDLAAAFADYEADRRPRASRVQKAARANGPIYHMGFPLALARDMVIRNSGTPLTDRYDWIYRWRADAAEAG